MPVAISVERKGAVRVLLHGIAALALLARNDRVGNGLPVIARAFMPVAISCMRKEQ